MIVPLSSHATPVPVRNTLSVGPQGRCAPDPAGRTLDGESQEYEMKIADIKLTGLTGGTVEGGWAEELAPEDNVHTVVEVLTDEGLVGVGSTFTSSHLVAASVRLLRPFLIGERADEPARVSEKLR